MAVLVTRPVPDNERTARLLRERGHEVELAPVMSIQPLPVTLDVAEDVTGIAVTSANTLRVIAGHPQLPELLRRTLFAVGAHTASAAAAMGFRDVKTAAGGVDSLIALIADKMRGASVLYIAGEDITRDLESALRPQGVRIRTETVYRMIPAQSLPAPASSALAAGRIEAVLHYSRRSAQAFVDLVAKAGLREAALAVPQCCLSPAVADILREAGAPIVIASSTPREQSLFEALDRALSSRSQNGT